MMLGHVLDALQGPLDPYLDTDCRTAAVLVAIYGTIPHVIMTRKSQHVRIHAGEISFPGGKPEKGDADLCATAMRETREEIGLDVGRDDIAGQLEPVTTRNSGFLILPFVTVLEDVPPLVPNEEVNNILHIPLEPLLSTVAPDTIHGGGMYALKYRDSIIWGASARILKQLHDIL